ncbi:MAG: FAD-binding oxidoreductase [Verrucomicrobia bacterium]|nr:FAD-binding oxidoreductase [Verrucomicrobiota bacterium]
MPTRTLSEHEQDLSHLCRQIREAKGLVCLKRNPSASHQTRQVNYKNGRTLLDLSAMRHVIGWEGDLLLCEPLVTMEELVAEALKRGRIPAIVPEFKEITVGGALQGVGLESSSHRKGQFNDICPFYEVILGNGERHLVSRDCEQELYHALPGSYGSLAITTLIAVETVPSFSHVELQGIHFHDRSACCDYLTTPQNIEFLEGFALGNERYLALQGNQCLAPQKATHIGRPMQKWFIQELLAGKTNSCVPLVDYLFRLDRGAFWMGRYLLHLRLLIAYLTCGNVADAKIQELLKSMEHSWPSRWFCALFGWLMTSKKLYQGFHQLDKKQAHRFFLIQDSFVNGKHAAEFVRHAEEEQKISPLWLCPVQKSKSPQLFSPQNIEGGPLLLNVGTYGLAHSAESLHHLEQTLALLKGRKALYSHSCYTREEFWKIYDETAYRKLRATYCAAGKFLSIEEKVF